MLTFVAGNKMCNCFLNLLLANQLRAKTSNKLHENE